MSPARDTPLYILAFDHRTSFRAGLFGIDGEPTAEQCRSMRAAKQVILDGLLATRGDVPPESIGALTDEQLGAGAARRAKSVGVPLAMCAEKSSVAEFDFEHGADFAAHIEAFEPELVKILARYNVEGDVDVNARQADRLARLSSWLIGRPTKFLFELIVEPTETQLTHVERDVKRFARERRPELMVRAIAELQQRGVEPDVWKVEGLDRREDCARVSEAARAGDRDHVRCLVLGAGAPQEVVEGWLREAAATPGYAGFAIGRTIWWDALSDWLAGRGDRDRAAARIAENYRRTVALYAQAAIV